MQSAAKALCTALVLACSAVIASGALAAGEDVELQARRLERQLLAPCCYQQTMDVHSSDLTSTLKQEIRDRLAQGEKVAQIERDLVAEYGERIRAVPPGSPLESVALVVMVLVFATGGVLWWRAKVWTRASIPHSATREESHPLPRDRYDDMIDRALED